MTPISCPSCGRTSNIDRDMAQSKFEWTCRGCQQHYEIRVVFLQRQTPIDDALFRMQLRRKMDDEGLSQSEVAELAGVSAAYISTVLRGKRAVSPRVAARVDEALGLGLGVGG